MTQGNETILVTAVAGLVPGTAALLLAVAAYVNSHSVNKDVRDNRSRLDSLENGGGDRKIDERLGLIGLVERRGAGELPTPVPIPAANGPLGAAGGPLEAAGGPVGAWAPPVVGK